MIHSFPWCNYVYKAAHLENIELINLFAPVFLFSPLREAEGGGDTETADNCPHFRRLLITPGTLDLLSKRFKMLCGLFSSLVVPPC